MDRPKGVVVAATDDIVAVTWSTMGSDVSRKPFEDGGCVLGVVRGCAQCLDDGLRVAQHVGYRALGQTFAASIERPWSSSMAASAVLERLFRQVPFGRSKRWCGPVP